MKNYIIAEMDENNITYAQKLLFTSNIELCALVAIEPGQPLFPIMEQHIKQVKESMANQRPSLPHLRFVPVMKKGCKLPQYNVFNRKDEHLAVIAWDGAWRQFVTKYIAPNLAEYIQMSTECELELVSFKQKLMMQWKLLQQKRRAAK